MHVTFFGTSNYLGCFISPLYFTIFAGGMLSENVSTAITLIIEFEQGLSNRRIGATSINADSSRSHSVFTCVVECRCKVSNHVSLIIYACLNSFSLCFFFILLQF